MSEASVTVLHTEPGTQLGQQLRQARQKAGMSLREMARRTNVSPSFVSQVELGRAAPSIGTLFAIVSELGLSLDSLMSGDPETDVSAQNPGPAADQTAEADSGHWELPLPRSKNSSAEAYVASLPEIGQLPGRQRANERPEISLGGVRWERLTPADDPIVEFLRVTYLPSSESCPPDNLMCHGGREYLHILSGRLEAQVAFARQVLHPGDSLNFDSSTPHRLSNPYEEPCIAIWVVVDRQGFALGDSPHAGVAPG